MITRSPCLHPGDIRVVQAMSAIDYPQLKHYEDVIVFSQKGFRPLPNMIAGGDLDGDTYFVTWDPRLIPLKEETAMDYFPPQEPESSNVTFEDVKDHFIGNFL
jgi:hypothetical protein